MIIWWSTPGGSGGGGGTSVDPGVDNVRRGVLYNINGVDLVGTYDIFVQNILPDGDIISISVAALAQFLRDQIVGLTVTEEWPYANHQLTYPQCTIFAGRAKRMPLMPEIIALTDPDVDNKIVATEVVAEYDFSLQLDLWAINNLQRKQQLAKVLTAFNAQEMDATGDNNPDGLTLKLTNYFNMPVRYEIDWHQHKDDEQAAERQERREMVSILVNLREVRQRTYYAMKNIETHVGVGPTDHDSAATDTGEV